MSSGRVQLQLATLLVAAALDSCGGSKHIDPDLAAAQAENTTEPQWVHQHAVPTSTAIVFVHGIWGDTLDTWKNANGVHFYDLLWGDERINKGIDIYAFGYPANVLKGSSLNIFEASKRMVAQLKYAGVLNYQRIVFIAHSMGGLVTLEALIDDADLSKKVGLVALYAIPMDDNQIAAIAQHIANNPALMQMADASYLQQLQDRWNNFAPQPKVVCAYEKTAIAGQIIVPWGAASRACKESYAISENHLNVVKPSSRAEFSYVVLFNPLADLMNAQATVAVPQASNATETPLISYEFDHFTNEKLCKGKLAKFQKDSEHIWSEFIPNDAACTPVRVNFVELGSDDTYFYTYDPNRNISDRIPKAGGNVFWITGKIRTDKLPAEGWSPVYEARIIK